MSLSENKLVIAILIAGLAGIICGWLFGPAMLAVAWLGCGMAVWWILSP